MLLTNTILNYCVLHAYYTQVGIKVSSALSPEDLMKLLDLVNPENIAGRVMLITRMHAKNLVYHLPKLIRAVQREGRRVLWVCDPMHGNTIKTQEGVKTRSFESIQDELRAFFDVHAQVPPPPQYYINCCLHHL